MSLDACFSICLIEDCIGNTKLQISLTEIFVFEDGCEDSTLEENGYISGDSLMNVLLGWNLLSTIIYQQLCASR
jgi:hypothetical protein